MAEQLPTPPVPAEADLRDFPFMPLDINRLFGSAFHARANDAEWRAGVSLWLKSYHQVPAGSLPEDDIELCRLAELGRDLRTWRKVKGMALYGWSKHADGRLYHATVTEKAAEAWRRKEMQRERSKKGNAKRWGANAGPGGTGGTEAPRERAVPEGSADGRGEESRPPIPREQASTPSGTAASIPQEVPEVIPKGSLDDPKGQGERQGHREGIAPLAEAASLNPPKSAAASSGNFALPPHLDRSVDQAFELYAEAAKANGWPDAMLLNSTRRYALQCRLAECGGLDGWRSALEAAKTADFLKTTDGQTQRWFDLDWLLKADKFTRLMEGRYAERHEASGSNADRGAPTVSDGIAAAFSRRFVQAGG